MELDKLSSTIPGISVALLGLIAPTAVFLALSGSQDGIFAEALTRLEVVAVMDVYLQMTTVFVSGFVLFISALLHFRDEHLSARLRLLYLFVLLITVLLWFWIFLLGGARRVPFELYARPVIPGVVSLPPFASWLTWARGLLAILGFVLAATEYRRDREPRHTPTLVPATELEVQQ